MNGVGKFIDNLKEREWNYFLPDGHTFCRGNYKNGKKCGEWIFFEKNKICAIGKFINGLKDGDWQFLYPSGQMIGVGKYVKGCRDGNWVGFYENGAIRTTQMYNNGKKEGNWIAYYDNGIIQTQGGHTESGLAEGRKDGIWKWFYYNGNIKMVGNYGCNVKIKEWTSYYENGNIKEKYIFDFDDFMVEEYMLFSEKGNSIQKDIYGRFGDNSCMSLDAVFPDPFKVYDVVEKRVQIRDSKNKKNNDSVSDGFNACSACQNPVPCGCNWSIEQNT